MTREIVKQLDHIFLPESVAIIGASNDVLKWGGEALFKLLRDGYKGTVYAVNPREKIVQGLPAYASILDVPGEVDMAMVTVRADLVPQTLRECARKGVKGAVVITAGFAEIGAKGRAIQEEMAGIARQTGLRFVGPNCMGIWNASNRLNLGLRDLPISGGIAFISQSGTFGFTFAIYARSRGYGLSKFISAGNQGDLEIADYLEYCAEDEYTKAIVIYAEGFKDGRKLLKVGREIAARKPVLIYKAGKNPSVARVALSHTASIAGEDRVFDALCKQAGFIRTDILLGSLDMAMVLTQQPVPRGNKVGIMGTGGQCVVLSDICASMGLQVPELNNEQMAFITEGVEFPTHAPPPRNPIDFAGANRTALTEAIVLNRMAQLDCIDMIVTNVPVTFHHSTKGTDAEKEEIDRKTARLLSAIPQKIGKPIITVMFGDPNLVSDITKKNLASAQIPALATPEEAARVAAILVEYAGIKARFAGDLAAR